MSGAQSSVPSIPSSDEIESLKDAVSSLQQQVTRLDLLIKFYNPGEHFTVVLLVVSCRITIMSICWGFKSMTTLSDIIITDITCTLEALV